MICHSKWGQLAFRLTRNPLRASVSLAQATSPAFLDQELIGLAGQTQTPAEWFPGRGSPSAARLRADSRTHSAAIPRTPDVPGRTSWLGGLPGGGGKLPTLEPKDSNGDLDLFAQLRTLTLANFCDP
jgi:hypothetical protein